MSNAAVSSLSNDTQALMAFEAGKKSTGLAYVLWLFLGGVGGHRFYLGRTGSAVGMLVLSVLGWLTVWVVVGFFLLVPLGIWLLVDLFLIPGMVDQHNGALMARLNGGFAQPASSPVEELAKFAALRDQGALSDEEYEIQKRRLIGSPPTVESAPATVG